MSDHKEQKKSVVLNPDADIVLTTYQALDSKHATKKKGKGKQRGGWKAGMSSLTTDGRKKCHKFQREQCKDSKCKLLHVCLVCSEPHPMKWCPRRPKQQQQR